MIRKIFAGVALLALIALPLPTAAQQGRPLRFEDFIGFPVPGDPQIAPDGKSVAYTVTTYSLAVLAKHGCVFRLSSPVLNMSVRRQPKS